MKKLFYHLFALSITAASLSSCSRANYAFTPNTASYLGSEKVSSAAAPVLADAPATASVQGASPDVLPAPAVQAGHALAHHAAPAPAPKATVAEVEAVVASVPATKAERKALRQQAIRQLAASPQKNSSDGKSQTTALILCILLGSIGVHQFYLGYTGRGLLRILLALTAFLIVPAIINLILYIIDIIKIVNGNLKPKNGEYAKKFNKE